MSLLQEMETYGMADEHLSLSEKGRLNLASYLVDYILEEQSRGNVCIDKWMVSDAIEAWQGGAR